MVARNTNFFYFFLFFFLVSIPSPHTLGAQTTATSTASLESNGVSSSALVLEHAPELSNVTQLQEGFAYAFRVAAQSRARASGLEARVAKAEAEADAGRHRIALAETENTYLRAEIARIADSIGPQVTGDLGDRLARSVFRKRVAGSLLQSSSCRTPETTPPPPHPSI